jgi:hypothetical protein
MKARCKECKSENILQEVSAMLNPNNPEASGVEFGSLSLDDMPKSA